MPPRLSGTVHEKAVAAAVLLLALVASSAAADEPAPAAPAATLTAPPPSEPPKTAPESLPPRQEPAPAAAPAPAEPPATADTNNVHSVGLALSFSTGAGFAYRRQWGYSSLQLAAFGIVTARGDSSLLSVGAQFGQRLHVWRGQSRSILPATSALRVVAGLNYFLNRSVNSDSVLFGSAINGTTCATPGGCTAIVTTNSSYFNGGAGLGFEFGAIDRPGVSMTLDVVLTAALKDGTFSFLLPLPQLAVLYNW